MKVRTSLVSNSSSSNVVVSVKNLHPDQLRYLTDFNQFFTKLMQGTLDCSNKVDEIIVKLQDYILPQNLGGFNVYHNPGEYIYLGCGGENWQPTTLFLKLIGIKNSDLLKFCGDGILDVANEIECFKEEISKQELDYFNQKVLEFFEHHIDIQGNYQSEVCESNSIVNDENKFKEYIQSPYEVIDNDNDLQDEIDKFYDDMQMEESNAKTKT